MADAQIAIIDGDQTQVVLAPGENPAIVSSIPGPQGPAGAGVPLGGTTNQVLFKQSGTNYDTAWGPITSAMIGDLEIVNADVSASAAIAGTKISPNFGSQTIQTTGVFSHALGTAGAPTITFTGDTNTGIYSPGADQLALSTNGTGRLFIDASGRVSVGSSSITRSFEINTTAPVIRLTDSDATGTPRTEIGAVDGNLTFAADQGSSGTGGNVIFYAPGANERLRITSAGLVGIGTSSPSSLIHVNSGASDLLAWMQARGANGLESGLLFLTKDSAGANVGGSIGHDGSTNTLYLTGITSGGTTQHVSITNTGRVGIGTTSPGTLLHIASSSVDPEIQLVRNPGSGNINSVKSDFYDLSVTSGRNFIVNTGGSERARIDSSGRLLVGTSSARTNFFNSTYGGIFQVETANNENGRVYSLTYGVAGIQGPILALAKHRTNTVGGIDPVISEDTLGAISFQGSDGSQFVESASIRANVDGTPGADDMPGRLVFSTTSDASASPTERLRITSAGVLQVADAGNIAVGTTTGTKIGTATTQKLGFFNKTPVVQPAAVADATDAASVITQLNALLARMRDLGLIAT